jgi:hypothetical protein
MADAEDLKSSGDFSSCGFDSHPGHHFQLLLPRSNPRVVVLLSYFDALMAK